MFKPELRNSGRGAVWHALPADAGEVALPARGKIGPAQFTAGAPEVQGHAAETKAGNGLHGSFQDLIEVSHRDTEALSNSRAERTSVRSAPLRQMMNGTPLRFGGPCWTGVTRFPPFFGETLSRRFTAGQREMVPWCAWCGRTQNDDKKSPAGFTRSGFPSAVLGGR